MIYILWTDITVISVEYPASLLQGWKTFPKTVNDNIIYQVHFLFIDLCSGSVAKVL